MFPFAVPQDHLLWSNRSHAYLSLDRHKEALDDAEAVIKLRPDWPKVSHHEIHVTRQKGFIILNKSACMEIAVALQN